ncbi:MAG: RNA pseudouridine synthase [Leptospiraceae bacterium]|nr:MAG: RNA pseudouridine synthase [Leptospiraceae bacterium]
MNPIYEDNHIIVISKPAGMLSQSDIKKQYSLYDYLKDYLKEKTKKNNVYLAILHRLDRNTGGIMVFAKTSKSARRLSEQFKNRIVQKKYIAITENIPEIGKKGKMINYLIKNEKKRIALPATPHHPKAKLAELEYELIETIHLKNKIYYKFLVHPLTGRFHQIRFQFAYYKAPLIGDRKYGNNQITPFPALWAYEIKFTHPTLRKEMIFKSEPPQNWPFEIV